ncbi:MAG: glycine-rich domain-containing protein, partial [Actinomycetes bacterium]
MVRRTVSVSSALLLAVSIWVGTPSAQAASVGSGACATTVDDATGVTSTAGSDGACIVTFATASTSPTTSAQYATRTWTVPAGITSVDVLVVAGGGGGGSSNGCCYDSGAGGGGGVVVASGFAVTPSASVTVLTGQGGRGTYCGNGYDGGRSQFSTLVAIGGGRGGGCSVSVGSGGSGGGAHCYSSSGSSTQASSGTASN